jgi:hypothetical protein
MAEGTPEAAAETTAVATADDAKDAAIPAPPQAATAG